MGVFKTLLQRAGFCRSVFYWMRFHGSGRRGARLVTGPDTHKQRGSRGRSPRLVKSVPATNLRRISI